MTGLAAVWILLALALIGASLFSTVKHKRNLRRLEARRRERGEL